ncbi:hypothetical protein BJ085DRAFT_13346 [Dimargaris cristalligena]|uniref:CBF1-interacting co-repressor CIR N-terminal domain-containing protein n=1 Tax=Dimargaris cristalligena TaxID=215637 RepID=A0A4Q0A1M9_9FUNG|nr:hypothetical protein BJ085DRAFT_13346 [Dimargaris cristalligena]|eukprot:RKP40036.1 hypothetical protein BJ085DRAFT_13346 [Dimargaris cristalligena]
MGGGDLNMKKSWHPLTFRNQEKLWKAEQRAEEEKAKTEQLRKERAEERALEELQQLQENAGHKTKSERLDWMYTGGGTGMGAQGEVENDEEREDYLLGRRRVDTLLDRQPDPEAKVSPHPSIFLLHLCINIIGVPQ